MLLCFLVLFVLLGEKVFINAVFYPSYFGISIQAKSSALGT